MEKKKDAQNPLFSVSVKWIQSCSQFKSKLKTTSANRVCALNPVGSRDPPQKLKVFDLTGFELLKPTY